MRRSTTSISEIITDILSELNVKNIIAGSIFGSCMIGVLGVLMILN